MLARLAGVSLSAVVPAHPISSLLEIGSSSAHVGYSRHALGTDNHRLRNIGPRNGIPATRASRGAPRGDDTVVPRHRIRGGYCVALLLRRLASSSSRLFLM